MRSPSALRRFEIPEIATFEQGEGDLIRLAVRSRLAEAYIYLHGAHLTHFQPKGAAPVLFMSAKSQFAADKPIRGGVPVIFPWFGPKNGRPDLPAHGFARTMDWEVDSLAEDSDGVVTASLQLSSDEKTKALWPHDFQLSYRVAIGRTLTMTLETRNLSRDAFTYEDALHTYFAVKDVRAAALTGLEGAEFLDKTDGFQRKSMPSEPFRVSAETDRIFESNRKTCTVNDPGMPRKITIEKSGSQTTVVWNPWVAKSAAMADFGDDEWPGMLCVETANAGANAITLDPEQSHTMRAVVTVG